MSIVFCTKRNTLKNARMFVFLLFFEKNSYFSFRIENITPPQDEVPYKKIKRTELRKV